MAALATPKPQKMNRGFTEKQLENEKNAKDFAWTARQVPSAFDPVQLKENGIVVGWLDWWNTRSKLFCCCFPCAGCLAGHKVIAGTDAEVWKKQLENQNPDCPPSMQGLWWLQYNIAHEQLVTIFSDAEFVGTYNEDGTDGYGMWYRPLEWNWSRENTCFGYILGISAKRGGSKVTGLMNLKDGILTVYNGKGQGMQMVYKITDDEWWKVHYLADPGMEGDQEINFMYKWLKVLDKDGNKTQHWDEYVAWTDRPLPHENCGTSWFPFWSCCLSNRQINENMIMPNKKQIVRFST